MNAQGCLTRMAEWTIGEYYQWPERIDPGPIRKVVEINRDEDWIGFENANGDILVIFEWRGRFIHVPNHNTPPARRPKRSRARRLARVARSASNAKATVEGMKGLREARLRIPAGDGGR